MRESAEYVISVVRSWQNWGNWNEVQRVILGDIIYHLEQAERAEELEQELYLTKYVSVSMESVERYTNQIKAENKRLREALSDILECSDIITAVEEIARQALEGEE